MYFDPPRKEKLRLVFRHVKSDEFFDVEIPITYSCNECLQDAYTIFFQTAKWILRVASIFGCHFEYKVWPT